MDEQANKRKISFRLSDPRADIVDQSFQNVRRFCYVMSREYQWRDFGKGKENILLCEVKLCGTLKMTIIIIIIIVIVVVVVVAVVVKVCDQ